VGGEHASRAGSTRKRSRRSTDDTPLDVVVMVNGPTRLGKTGTPGKRAVPSPPVPSCRGVVRTYRRCRFPDEVRKSIAPRKATPESAGIDASIGGKDRRRERHGGKRPSRRTFGSDVARIPPRRRRRRRAGRRRSELDCAGTSASGEPSVWTREGDRRGARPRPRRRAMGASERPRRVGVRRRT